MNNKGLAAICLLVVAGILAAALWPFSPHPRNEVTWAPDGRGLRFGDYGSIFSSSDAVLALRVRMEIAAWRSGLHPV